MRPAKILANVFISTHTKKDNVKNSSFGQQTILEGYIFELNNCSFIYGSQQSIKGKIFESVYNKQDF